MSHLDYYVQPSSHYPSLHSHTDLTVHLYHTLLSTRHQRFDKHPCPTPRATTDPGDIPSRLHQLGKQRSTATHLSACIYLVRMTSGTAHRDFDL